MAFSCHRKLVVSSDYKLQKENHQEELIKLVQVQKDSLKTYATAVSAYTKYFSGVTYFKNTQDTALRVLFTTHTGLKLLDLQLSEKGCSTVYAIEQMNNPVVLKLLCHDFGLVAGIGKEVEATAVYLKPDQSKLLVQKGEKDLYYFVTPQHEVVEIKETVPGKKRIQTEVRRNADSSLVVRHRNFNFKMTLKTLTLD